MDNNLTAVIVIFLLLITSLIAFIVYDIIRYKKHAKKIQRYMDEIMEEIKRAEAEEDPDVLEEIEEIKLDLKELRGIEFPEDTNLL